MFLGEYSYKVDDKGRAPVPPRFRQQLKDGIVLVPGMERCITAYPVAEWKRVSAGISPESLGKSKDRHLARALFATSFLTIIDGQGRISLPAPLKARACISDEVVFAGANTYMEIWDRTLWEEERESSLQQAWQIIESQENR
jgi:MraZ protein